MLAGERRDATAPPPGGERAERAVARAAPRRSIALAAALLPGLLAGAHLAALLFFLNPELPFGVGLLARGGLLYGPLVAAAWSLPHLPLVARAPRRMLRLLPWELTAVFAAAALLDGLHASHFAFYLPAGINVRLIKAASGSGWRRSSRSTPRSCTPCTAVATGRAAGPCWRSSSSPPCT